MLVVNALKIDGHVGCLGRVLRDKSSPVRNGVVPYVPRLPPPYPENMFHFEPVQSRGAKKKKKVCEYSVPEPTSFIYAIAHLFRTRKAEEIILVRATYFVV